MSSNKDTQDIDNQELNEGSGVAEEQAQETAEAAGQADAGEQTEGDPEAAKPAPEPTPEEKMAALEAKATENWDKFLRANAELENVRKRARRDVESAHKYGLEKFANSLLDVCDSMEQGLERARKAAEANPDHSEVAGLVEGMELTARVLTDALTKHGVAPIEAKGAAFDPELHEAMTAIETPDQPPNTVIDVMRQGYTLSDRLLRPAMVIVSKAAKQE